MHKPQITRITLAVLCAFPFAADAQQGLQLKSQPTLVLTPPPVKEDVPLFLEAEQLQGHTDRETEASGDVRLRKRGQAVHAERLRHDQQVNELTAEGNVRLEQGASVVEGARLQYNLDTDRGFMETPRFTLHRAPSESGERQLFGATDARGRLRWW